jgi:hypothetical protein
MSSGSDKAGRGVVHGSVSNPFVAEESDLAGSAAETDEGLGPDGSGSAETQALHALAPAQSFDMQENVIPHLGRVNRNLVTSRIFLGADGLADGTRRGGAERRESDLNLFLHLAGYFGALR